MNREQHSSEGMLYSTGAEASVLGGLMLDNDRWDEVAPLLNSSDFYYDQHQIIFREIERLVSAGQPIDLITLTESLERKDLLDRCGGFAWLAELSKNTPSAANIVPYAGIVRDYSRKRQLMKLGHELHQQAATGDADISGLIEKAEKQLFGLSQQVNTPEVCLSVTTQVSDTVGWLESVSGGRGLTGTPTGFTELNEKTCGWQNGDLILLGARPSMGKTAEALTHAVAALEGCPDKTVQLYSIEMPVQQLILRLLSQLALVPFDNLRKGQLSEGQWGLLSEAITRLTSWEGRLLIDDTSWQTPSTLRISARRNVRKYGHPSLILVDYLQLMSCPGRENRTQEIQEISRSLKALAKEIKCPVVALSQLNRSVEQRQDKRPALSDLRDSGSLEQDADVILFLYRDEIYDEHSPDRGVAEIILGKQRQGPLGTVKVRFEGEYMRFSEYHLGYGEVKHG
ncbi:replicative DNA helicase [Salmonella enterica subsp. enterica serovar Virchow]|nr:replicative DNA helicase [Salmonella enterica subsp. enterica serovar Virchow]